MIARALLATALSGPTLAACAGTTVSSPIASLPVPSPDRCEQGRFTAHGSANADWVQFLRLGDVSYLSARYLGETATVPGSDRGTEVARVRCTLDRHDIAGTAALRDGDAAYLPEGTPIYAVRGYPSSCRVVVRDGGVLTTYYATSVDAPRTPIPCARG